MNHRDDTEINAHAAPPSPPLPDAAGEYLAGMLAMSRLSRVTVALKCDDYPAENLLAVARMSGIPGEATLLFDRWEDGEAELAKALREARIAADDPPVPSVRNARPLLAILDRFEKHLRLPAEDLRAQADERTLCELAADPGADVHFLLLVEESAAPLLQRYESRIPGISGASLRLPPANAVGTARAKAPERKRSFGSLLERLNDHAATTSPAASTEHAIEARAAQQAEMPPLRQDGEAAGAGNFWKDEPDQRHQAAERHVPEQEHEDAPLADERHGEIAAQPAFEAEPVATIAEAGVVHDAGNTSAAVEARPIGAEERPEPLPAGMPREVEPPSGRAEAILPALAPEAVPPAARPKRPLRAAYFALAGIAAAAIGWILWTRQPHDADARPQQAATEQARSETGAQAPATGAAVAASTATPKHKESAPQVVASVPARSSAPAPASGAAQPVPPSAPAVAAVAAVPAALPAATANPGKTSLYIVVGNSRDRERMLPIAQALGRQGIHIVAVSQAEGGPKVSDLRYFYPAEREDALRLQQALQEAGVAVRKVNLVPGYEDRATHRQFELWLAGDGVLKAPENATGFARNR